MKQYIVRTMDKDNYCTMMSGGYCYGADEYIVEAETEAEAVEIAKRGGYFYVDEHAETVEEREAEIAANREWYATLPERLAAEKAARAAKKAARDAEKAAAAGLSVEAYTARRDALAKAKRHETEARHAREAIEELQKSLAYHEKKAAQYRAEAGE